MNTTIFDFDRPVHDKPLAAAGLTSYRCRGRYGWIMIGAHNRHEAWSEAQRSSDAADRNTLQVWTGDEYEDVNP
jgi:hypothetical protein